MLRWFVGPDRWLVGLEQGCLGEVIVGGWGVVEVLMMVSRYEITLVLLCDMYG